MRCGFQAHEHESGMTDGGIREHPLHVCLYHGKDRADHQRQHGEHDDRRAPVVHAGWESNHEYPNQRGKGGNLAD